MYYFSFILYLVHCNNLFGQTANLEIPGISKAPVLYATAANVHPQVDNDLYFSRSGNGSFLPRGLKVTHFNTRAERFQKEKEVAS